MIKNTMKIFYKSKERMYKIGIIIVVVFGIELFGLSRYIFGFRLVNIRLTASAVGLGIIFLVPEYYFNSEEYAEKYGKYNPMLASYWVFSLIMGMFFAIVPFVL